MKVFDLIYIAIGENAEKTNYFNIDKRLEWIGKVFEGVDKIRAIKYSGLTVDLCREVGAGFILRGLRTSADFEFERSIGQINKNLDPDLETVFLLTAPEYTALNSSIVRDILRHGGDPSKFVPGQIAMDILAYGHSGRV
jgi:pantetheine-phosphate adenylyltransferase